MIFYADPGQNSPIFLCFPGHSTGFIFFLITILIESLQRSKKKHSVYFSDLKKFLEMPKLNRGTFSRNASIAAVPFTETQDQGPRETG